MIKALLSLIILFISTQLIGQTEHSYEGVQVCTTCHKSDKQGKQLDIWKMSQHSNAYKTLQTEKANDIAKEKGYTTAAAQTEACLKCHVSGYSLELSMLGTKFKLEDGVQCETCHGPGSDYKPLKIMKSREASVANGLKIYEKIEDLCVKCHNSESPTFKEMNFAVEWEKIKHPVPGK